LQTLNELALNGDADIGESRHARIAHDGVSGTIRLRVEAAAVRAAERGRQADEVVEQRTGGNVLAFGNRALRNVREAARKARIARRAAHELGELRGELRRPRIPLVRIVAGVTLALGFRQRRVHRRQKAKDLAGYL
jgi:hypothetical protein